MTVYRGPSSRLARVRSIATMDACVSKGLSERGGDPLQSLPVPRLRREAGDQRGETPTHVLVTGLRGLEGPMLDLREDMSEPLLFPGQGDCPLFMLPR